MPSFSIIPQSVLVVLYRFRTMYVHANMDGYGCMNKLLNPLHFNSNYSKYKGCHTPYCGVGGVIISLAEIMSH